MQNTLRRVFITATLIASLFTVVSAQAKQTKSAAAVKKPEATTLKAKGGVKWTGYGVGKSHTGDLTLKSGTLQMKGKEITGGEFIIDMNSITYKNKRLETHLKSADFFDVTKPGFDTATYKITKVEAIQSPGTKTTHKIIGDLTIKGKTHPFDIMAVVTQDGKKWKATGDGEIKDRTAYDIKYNSAKFAPLSELADKAIEDKIAISIDVVAE